jgi:O-succinylbenzoic acid--CoA ligase
MTRIRPIVRIARQDDETVAAIHAALDAKRPIALIHPGLPSQQLTIQQAAAEAASFVASDAIVLFTSGSTGEARGVVLSREAIFAAADATWAHIGERPDDIWHCPLSLAHAGGLAVVVRSLRSARGSSVPRVSSTCTLGDDVTLVSLVPAQLAELLADQAWQPPLGLRAVLLGGASAPQALIERALARGVPVYPTYGMTESFGMVATAATPGGPLVPLPGVELFAGTHDAPTVIRIRGPMLATRYLDGAPIAPELATRDLGILDHGRLTVVGRIDDLIITGGENVFPAYVEAALARTPGVRAVAVFGVPDARWGQLVAAAVVVDDRFSTHVAYGSWHAALPSFARPRRIARVEVLPQLPSGKLDRRALTLLPTVPIDYT